MSNCQLWKNHYSNIFNDMTHSSYPLPQEVLATAPNITVQEVEHAIKSLNTSSSPGHDGVTPLHVSCAHPTLYALLTFLFNCCIKHSVLPDNLLKVVISPIVKDKNGNLCSINNYRPIALSTILSKILELILLNRCSDCLATSDHQFAYKQIHCTDMAINVLKNVTLQYTERNTPVYACFLDMSKAFDKVSHGLLFKTLIRRGVPKYIVHLLQTWYSSQKMVVRWGDVVRIDCNLQC